MKKVAKRIHRTFSPEEKREHEKLVRQVETDKPELMAIGRALKAQHQRRVRAVLDSLQEAKVKSGLSLADLTDRTGIDRASLSRLLSGRANPTLLTLNRIAEALNRELVVELKEST